MSALQPIVLIIRDGWGIGPDYSGNAIAEAKTPNLDSYLSKYPYSILGASGTAVGLVDGSQGSSEVGHLNIGAGRIVEQEVVRVNKIIDDKSFYTHPKLMETINHCKKHNSQLHLIGLVQDQGVHAIDTHLFALLRAAKQHGMKRVFIHFISDGRDTPPKSAMTCLGALKDKINEIGIGQIASVMGRYFAMDRDQNWERVEIAYNALTARAEHTASSAESAIELAYQRGETDEFIAPTLISDDNDNPVSTIKDNDGIIFFNYRQDRAIELTQAFIEDDFAGFQRQKLSNLNFLGFTKYYDSFSNYLIPPMNMKNILGEMLEINSMHQLRVSETQKYKHVTSFLNSKREEPFKGEDRILVDSPKVSEDKVPEMSAYQITDILLETIGGGQKAASQLCDQAEGTTFTCDPSKLPDHDHGYDVIICNYVNADMVGHTGSFDAAVKAAEVVDSCVGKIVEATLAAGGVALITADHGNSEQMTNPETGDIQTSHTLNDVHFIYIASDYRSIKLQKKGILSNISPTILDLLAINKPEEMTSDSLIIG